MRKIAIIGTELPALQPRASKVELFEWDDIDSIDVNLRDYDGVVLDVSGLLEPVPRSVQTIISPNVVRDILKDADSFVVVIGNPETILTDESVASRLGINVNIIRGKGDSIKAPEELKSNKYTPYTNKVKQYPYSYKVSTTPTQKLGELLASTRTPVVSIRSLPFLMTKAGYAIATLITAFVYKKDHRNILLDSHEPFKGSLVLLPPLDSQSDQLETILNIVDSVDANELPVPDWVEEVSAVGQDVVDAQTQKTEEQLIKLTEQLETLKGTRGELRQGIEVLYKTDKPLEKSLKSYLKKVGFEVIEPDTESNKVEFYLKCGELKFVVEVKSTAKQMFDQKGLRQANDWRDDVLLGTGEAYKPLFIGSNQYKLKPSERSDDYLAQNLIDYAVSRDIVCITVGQLFNELQRIEAKEMVVNELAQKLHSTKGLYVTNQIEEGDSPVSKS